MTLELSELERRTLLGSLEAYRRIKGAERMLKSQKDTSLYPKYDTLLECIKGLQTRLATLDTIKFGSTTLAGVPYSELSD